LTSPRIDTPRPCLLEIHTIDAGENIDRDRLPPKADEFLGIRKVVNGNVGEGSTEAGQRRIGRLRVLRVRLDEQIEVFGRAGLRVKRNRVAVDHEIFNAVGVEDRQEFFEVVEPRGPVPSWRQAERVSSATALIRSWTGRLCQYLYSSAFIASRLSLYADALVHTRL